MKTNNDKKTDKQVLFNLIAAFSLSLLLLFPVSLKSQTDFKTNLIFCLIGEKSYRKYIFKYLDWSAEAVDQD